MATYTSCPFNPNHRVPKERLQNHIIRCMVNYPDYVPCIYNALHRLPNKELMMEHLKTCPSRRDAKVPMVNANQTVSEQIANVLSPSIEFAEVNTNIQQAEEEDWCAQYR